jgi:hypothetical protein
VPTAPWLQAVDFTLFLWGAAAAARLRARRELPNAADFAEPFTVR